MKVDFHLKKNRTPARAGIFAAVASAFALIMTLSVFAPLVHSQTVQGGHIGDPVPSAPHQYPNGRNAPGCLIAFSSPKWPGEGLDFPCAGRCTGPNARQWLTIEALRANCDKMGPFKVKDISEHPDFPDRPFLPALAPEGSTNCWIMTGDRGMPNSTIWYPKGDPRCAGVSGEPHLTTFDQLRFDLQAAGEFIAAKSLDDEFEVQMRLEPLSLVPAVSFATAVAARVGPHRVMIAGGNEVPLRLDGEPVELSDGYSLLINDGRSSIIRTGNRYSVVWPDGTNLHVDLFSNHVDLYLLPAEQRDGRLVGVLGDSDGDKGENDFRTRDGRALASPPEFETLYRVFAESWRIQPAESLFDYAAGESTETFTLRGHPKVEMKISNLPPADRTRAEQRCREAGISDAQALADCIFDFGLTGDEEFIESALSNQTPSELMGAAAPVGVSGSSSAPAAGAVTIEAPREGIAAHAIELRIDGPVEAGYWLGFAEAGSYNNAGAGNPNSGVLLNAGDRVVRLAVPTIPGDYELRYREPRGRYRIFARQPFQSIAPSLTIEAPAAAEALGSIDVSVVGDVGEYMNIIVAPAGSGGATGGPGLPLTQGNAAGGTIPRLQKDPGDYEIRVVSRWGAGRQVYARRKLTVR